MSNKGFTLIEMCLVLMIISMLSIIPFDRAIISIQLKEILNELITIQYRAFTTLEKQSIDLSISDQTVTYNTKGNISQAMRIELPEQRIRLTLMLATGRIFVRRVELD